MNVLYVLMIFILIVNIKKIIDDFNLLRVVYVFLSKNIKHKRLMVALVSSFFGVLPVHGRNILSAPILKSFISYDDKAKNRIGIVNYLTTHHYYLWSPIEKTILIPMLTLGLSYSEMLKYTFPVLLMMLLFTIAFIFFGLKEEDITFHNVECKKKVHKSKWHEYINWKLIGLLTVVLTLNWWIKSHADLFTSFIQSSGALPIASLVAFGAAFILGSSAKSAGIVALLTSIFGLEYLTFFICLEFSAYLLSPTHKCIVITNEYFDTDYLYFYKIIGLLSLGIILLGILSLLFLNP